MNNAKITGFNFKRTFNKSTAGNLLGLEILQPFPQMVPNSWL